MFESILNRSAVIDLDEFKVRLITPKDVKAITAYYQRNRAFLKPWEPLREEAFFTEVGWGIRLDQLVQLHKHKLAYYFVIQEKGSQEIAGVVNYSNLVRHPFYACHVGYSLDQSWQGRGVMIKALEETVAWMFKEQGFHRIMAAYMPHNERSAAVLAKCGFEAEGRAKKYLLINGQWEDHILTARMNPDWVSPV
ncbi:ribosomal protein S5-alanine N-acetyltransferase [Photobacterium makurazakiensis]|uniref:ribosomal protein S5-alanine N-acetyltransferase n=1 Tax=Photobacterium makurazakiensis TaxID=2910234 RepID=UPI003D1222E6